MLNPIEWLMKMFGYPEWAYKLECHVCEMTFISPEAHYKYVSEMHSKKDKYIPKVKK